MSNDAEERFVQLTTADVFALEAASGWLMLGNAAEALKELSGIPPERATHPKVCLALWEVHAHQKAWPEAAEVGRRLMDLNPNLPDGYIKRAFALHEMKLTGEAWRCLRQANRRFRGEWIIPYNLACYACQLGRERLALRLLRRAQQIGDSEHLKRMALEDPDLAPIRLMIEGLSQKPSSGSKRSKTL